MSDALKKEFRGFSGIIGVVLFAFITWAFTIAFIRADSILDVILAAIAYVICVLATALITWITAMEVTDPRNKLEL